MSSQALDGEEPQTDNWRNTILAGLANYIDAGSIVAGAAALALWKEFYNLSNDFVGLIAAFGPNAIGAGIGALIGGWLCDKLGRKRIYQYDMLVYALGMGMLVFRGGAMDDRYRFPDRRPRGGRRHSGQLVADRRRSPRQAARQA